MDQQWKHLLVFVLMQGKMISFVKDGYWVDSLFLFCWSYVGEFDYQHQWKMVCCCWNEQNQLLICLIGTAVFRLASGTLETTKHSKYFKRQHFLCFLFWKFWAHFGQIWSINFTWPFCPWSALLTWLVWLSVPTDIYQLQLLFHILHISLSCHFTLYSYYQL